MAVELLKNSDSVLQQLRFQESTPMELWLVRHAVAAEQDEFEGPDAERPLTPKGRRRFREFCQGLAKQAPMPQRIITSPLVRAAQTAALLAPAAGIKKREVIVADLLAPGVELGALLTFVRSQPGGRIALVGHEPDMSHVLSELVGGGTFRFSKGFVAAVEFDSAPAAGAGRLGWFIGPKLAR
jgi:phosphohistidine phosphatase